MDYNKDQLEESPLKTLSRELRKCKQGGILPVLLIDEFEKLSEKKRDFYR